MSYENCSDLIVECLQYTTEYQDFIKFLYIRPETQYRKLSDNQKDNFLRFF